MRPIRPGNKVFIPLFVLAMASLVAWNTQRNGGERPSEPERFDFFLLAMTAHPAFCRDGHARKPECRAGRAIPLSIHGLWPEAREPGRYPRDCAGPALRLEAGLERELGRLMPGMSDGLHEHEWRTHGTCSGLGDDAYFDLTLRLARDLDEALGARLTSLAGRSTSAADLRAHAERRAPGIGATLTFHCRTLRDAPVQHRGQAHLVEVRQCVSKGRDGLDASPVSCARFNRRDQGCGRQFRIAAPGAA